MVHTDRLSELPDSLLVQILSPLEMKDTVKTGILSRRWKHLWTQTPNVVYEFKVRDGLEKMMSCSEISDWKEEHLPQLLSFIDRTLPQCVSCIEKFSLTGFGNTLCSDRFVADFVDRWIAFVSSSKMGFLNLDLYLYLVPDCLYTDFSALTMLRLDNVRVHVISPVNWPLLKSLELGFMILEDATIANILLGSPMLETITLNAITGIKYLNIMSRSVQCLALFNIKYLNDDILEIRAPWLQRLEIDGTFFIRKCLLVDVSSLSRACVTFCNRAPCTMHRDYLGMNIYLAEYYHAWNNMAVELLKGPLCCVGELYIGSELIQVLSMLKVLGKPSPSFKCKNMIIFSPIWKYDFPGIAYLLENAYDLEALVIKVHERKLDCPSPLPKICDLLQNQGSFSSYPVSRFEHLKYIKVDYSINPLTEPMPMSAILGHGACFDFELLIYLLRSAVALERLVIVISMIPSCFNHVCLCSSCVYHYVENLSSELLATALGTTERSEWQLRKTKTRFEFTRSKRASISPKD